MKILVATNNPGKQREYRELLRETGWELIFPDPGKDVPELEGGSSYRENAESKARYFAAEYRLPALGDDSGLEVEALGGAPGVFSARYCPDPGPEGKDEANNRKLLRELEGTPPEQRQATFRCVIAAALPSGPVLVVEGICKGYIISENRGENGFGYDPLFLFPELNQTLAEIGPEEKNRISHRARAVKRLVEAWPELARKLKPGW